MPALARHFALAFQKALRKQEEKERSRSPALNPSLSMTSCAGSWTVEHQWHRKSSSHINVLESLAFVSVLKKLAAHGHSALRFNALLDSRVAKGAHAKGRSTFGSFPLDSIRVVPSLLVPACIPLLDLLPRV